MTIFPRQIFYNLTQLQEIFADNYKLCCPAILPPGFNVLNCHAPSDEVSSCDDLLRSGVYRAGVAIFASLALLGNLSSLVYRLMLHKTSGNVGYDVFVTNLCVADFLMGLYLSIIGIADFRYRGSYVWEDVGWRNSSLCKLAGFTSLLSCEVSVFIIFLITVDRFLVLRFPFSQVHFGKRSAQCACAVSWLTGVAFAVVPLLPMTSHWQFYSQTSICVPLPTSRVQFPGRVYAFGVIIILNFILSVHTNSMSAQNISKARKEVTIAKRLITVVMSDFLCWFPVGLTGILASSGIPISGEVNVGIAVFVLPINAAVNPFLYTINIYLERRRERREEERRKRLVNQLKFANGFAGNTKATLTTNDIIGLLKTLLSMKTFSHTELQEMLEDTA
ncbi:G-protein coupled receptor GRL101-like [Pomacea canaliculata]|uniref:G-protein coupled receptor GRL101-like n=1 Tax=Pomacea canaliculata TaxID=400727 RepID=UPI000D7334E7|nr:G-protein coupled receptor GRL101-like [Pomacea canaliculata]